MNQLLVLARWETRRLWRTGTARAALTLLFIAGLIAIGTTSREIARQEREIAALPADYATKMERIAHKFPEGEHAGYIAYYTFFPTHHTPTGLANLALGLRDVVPATLWVRLLGLEGQLYESSIGNPALQALGTFDLAFVLCALAPLVLLILTHDILTRDREQCLLPLALAQGGGLGRLFVTRLLVRSGAVAGVCVGLFIVALIWRQIPLDGAAWAWIGAALLHLACWSAIAAVIAAGARTISASLAAAGATWVGAVVILPAILNLVIVSAYPVPDGLEVTVRQRQETHGGWDKPKEETFTTFFQAYPQWRDTTPVTGRFAWKWYYAMHHVGDASVATDSAAYRENLLARSRAMTRLAWLAPPIAAQLMFSRTAHTDLEAHLGYLDRVREFHEELKTFFHPLVFAESRLEKEDYRTFPGFRATSPEPTGGVTGQWAGLSSILLPTILLAGLARHIVQRIRT